MNKAYWALLKKEEQTYKCQSHLDLFTVLANQQNLHQSWVVTKFSLKDLRRLMDNRDRGGERVKEIGAMGATW